MLCQLRVLSLAVSHRAHLFCEVAAFFFSVLELLVELEQHGSDLFFFCLLKAYFGFFFSKTPVQRRGVRVFSNFAAAFKQ